MNKHRSSNPEVEGSSPSWGTSETHTRAMAGRGQGLPDYLTTDEVAEELDYHVESVRHLIRCGKLEADKKGVWLIPRESLVAFKKANEGKSKHDPTRGPQGV